MTDPNVRFDRALFVIVDDDTVLPTAFSRGPWSLDWLHGGPVAALLAHAVERSVPDGVEWFMARLTVELQRPVPLERLCYGAEVTRAGRKVATIEGAITSADTGAVLARVRALAIRIADIPLPLDDPDLGPLLAIEPAPCEPGQGRSGTFDEHAPPAFHNAALEQRFVGESELRAGPVFDWIRVGVPLLPDHPLTPLQRVAAAVDNASGVSSVLPADSHSFINPDLTVHLFRPLIGEWVGMASVTHHSIHGVGMTDTAIFDRDGRIGRSNQSLVLDLR